MQHKCSGRESARPHGVNVLIATSMSLRGAGILTTGNIQSSKH
jgi:hypothetical protein